VGDVARPVIRTLRVLVPALVRGLALVHLGALGLLALVISVERQAGGGDTAGWLGDVLQPWSRLCPALTLLGAALARARMKSTLLVLGSVGLPTAALPAVAVPLGAAIGALGLLVPARGAGSAWSRGLGGWLHHGHPVPDLPGGVVSPAVVTLAWPLLAACVVAAPLGARAWAPGPLAVVVGASILADAAWPGGGVAVLLAASVVVLLGASRGRVHPAGRWSARVTRTRG